MADEPRDTVKAGEKSPAASRSEEQELAQRVTRLAEEWNLAVAEAHQAGLHVQAEAVNRGEVGSRNQPLLHCRVSREIEVTESYPLPW